MLSRRHILTTGAASAVILAGGTALYANGPGLDEATAPWTQAGESFGDPRLDALAYAILAPNSHNIQPWMFQLIDDTGIDVYCDLTRLLPETDPFNRQITVSFGCMLELLRQAGAEKGYRVTYVPFPDGDAQPNLNGNRIAHVTFVRDPGVERDPLFGSILNRRSTKVPYDMSKPVEADTLTALLGAHQTRLVVDGSTAPVVRDQIVDLAVRGWVIEYETDQTRRESIKWMRIGNRAIRDNPDGIELGGLGMGLAKMFGMVTKESLDTPGSMAYQSGIDMYLEMIRATPGFFWVVSPDNSRQTQLEAGRAWVRTNLMAQSLGLCIHPLSQVLQEFPEMAEPYRQIHELLTDSGQNTVQMLGRIGYSRFSSPTPRWPVTSKMMESAV